MNVLTEVGLAMVFNGLDIITGIVAALREKNIKSYRLRDGLFKKTGFMFCYLLGWILDTYGIDIGFHVGVKILPVIILYSVTTELVSIIENIHKINPELLPDKLADLFHLEGTAKGN